MSDVSQPTAAVRSRVDRRRRISLIWAIPLVTALIALWLVWDTYAKRGPTITITFDGAEDCRPVSRTSSTRTSTWVSCSRSR